MSWRAFKVYLTYQSWFSRLGIQCFSDGVCFVTVLLSFYFLHKPLSFFLIWEVTGGLGAAWFGTAFTFLIFYKLFNFLMEALLALLRSYGQTRTKERFSGKQREDLFGPPLTLFKQIFNFVLSRTGWLSGSFLVLGSLCCNQSFFLLHLVCCYVPN